ncbi:MAG: PAS domain S-box protein [Candidatus Brocadiia bacterium]
MASAANRHLELKTVLSVALKETLALMRVGGGIIYLYDKASHRLAPAAHRGVSAALLSELHSLRLGESFSGAVAASRKPLVIPDFRKDARLRGSPAARRGLCAYAGVPVLSRRKVLGVFAILDRRPGRFTKEDVALLGRIASQAGAAIENAQLYEEVRRELAARKQAEAALRESEERFRVVFERAAIGITLLNLRGRILHTNPAFQEMLSYTAGELRGKHFAEISHPREVKLHRNLLRAVAAGKQSRAHIEKRYICKDGRIVWTDLNCCLHRDAAGKPLFVINMIENITERKLADKEKAQSAMRYRDLFENSGTGIVIVDQDGRYLMMNKIAAARMGKRPEEVSGKSMFDLLPVATARKYLYLNRRFIRRGGSRVYEDAFSLDTGERTFLIVDRCLKDATGRNFAIQSSSVDITDRKRAEEALRLSEARYRRLYESIRDAFASVDMKGRILECNPAFEQLMGYSAKELRRMTYLDLTPKRWHAFESQTVHEQVLKRGYSDVYEKEYRRKDGTVFPVELRVYLIKDPSGRPATMWAIVRDITQRKRGQEALRESEERFRTLFSKAPIGVATADAQCRFLDANDVFCRMLGYSKEELLRKTIPDVTLPDDRPALLKTHADVSAGLSSGYSAERRYVRKDGSLLFGRITTQIIRDAEDKFLYGIGMLEDVTDRRRAEEKLKTYQERLRSLASQLALAEERERRRIATALHDEVGQSLALARLKLGELAGASPRQEFTALVQTVYEMIAQILQRTRSLTFELSPPILYELGLGAALGWLVEEFRKQHPIRWEFLSDGLDPPLENDVRVTLFQGARELLFNIVKHARAETVTMLVECDPAEVRIRVQDDGDGFAADEFWSNPKAMTGFGLFSVRERLESLGGRLEIDSRIGGGTRATLAAPLESADIERRSTPGSPR